MQILQSLAFANNRHFHQATLQHAEHVLQLSEFAGAIALGNGGIDGFR